MLLPLLTLATLAAPVPRTVCVVPASLSPEGVAEAPEEALEWREALRQALKLGDDADPALFELLAQVRDREALQGLVELLARMDSVAMRREALRAIGSFLERARQEDTREERRLR